MNLQKIRKEKGKTQKEVAKDLYIDVTTMCNYEKGKSEPSINTLISLANYYDVSLDYLCGRENKNLIFIDTLSPIKKELINIVKSLNDEQATIAVGYLGRMANKPLTEIMEITLKNK